MSLIMPVFAVTIIVFGLVRRVPVFEAFLTGAREGAQTLLRIAPTILALIFAVGLLKSSGAV
ncbi:MAG: spore maturation protein, partial [Ruminococcus sp.]|nr:spore maturation protein [Ruminococcus sp.]